MFPNDITFPSTTLPTEEQRSTYFKKVFQHKRFFPSEKYMTTPYSWIECQKRHRQAVKRHIFNNTIVTRCHISKTNIELYLRETTWLIRHVGTKLNFFSMRYGSGVNYCTAQSTITHHFNKRCSADGFCYTHAQTMHTGESSKTFVYQASNK